MVKKTSEQPANIPVKDAKAGAPLGWVHGPLYDAHGEIVSELALHILSQASEPGESENGERLIGSALHLTNGRLLGSIVDVVGRRNTGELQGLIVESRETRGVYSVTAEGLVYEDGYWILLGQSDAKDDGETKFDRCAHEPGVTDWMIGRRAQSELVTSQGAVIIKVGQAITEATVALAARERLLHLLDAD